MLKINTDEQWAYTASRASNVPLRSRKTQRLDTFSCENGNNEALEAARTFCGECLDMSLTEAQRAKMVKPFLLFYSLPGLGKTHLCIAIAWEFLEFGQYVHYFQAEEFIETVSNYESGNYHTKLDHIRNDHLLIIDDIGAQFDSDFGRSKLDMIFDYRYRNWLPTILTTNDLRKIPERIVDRMKEGRSIGLNGKSWRGSDRA